MVELKAVIFGVVYTVVLLAFVWYVMFGPLDKLQDGRFSREDIPNRYKEYSAIDKDEVYEKRAQEESVIQAAIVESANKLRYQDKVNAEMLAAQQV